MLEVYVEVVTVVRRYNGGEGGGGDEVGWGSDGGVGGSWTEGRGEVGCRQRSGQGE